MISRRLRNKWFLAQLLNKEPINVLCSYMTIALHAVCIAGVILLFKVIFKIITYS